MSTAEMFDAMTEQSKLTYPTQIEMGSLVYLFPPGETPWTGNRPITVRVERTSMDSIVGIDVRDGGRGIYTVGGRAPAYEQWTWELLSPPLRPACDGIEIVDAVADIAERTDIITGGVGHELQVRLTSGDLIRGRLTRLVMGRDDWEPEWAELVDPVPGRDTAVHVVRISEVASVTRFRVA